MWNHNVRGVYYLYGWKLQLDIFSWKINFIRFGFAFRITPIMVIVVRTFFFVFSYGSSWEAFYMSTTVCFFIFIIFQQFTQLEF